MSHTVYLVWGESPEAGETPIEYSFDTAAELAAFWQGVLAGDGWAGWTEVDGPEYTVDEYGNVVNRRAWEWTSKVDPLLEERYGICLADCIDDTDIEKHLDTPPEEFVDWIAEKRDLTPLKEGL